MVQQLVRVADGLSACSKTKGPVAAMPGGSQPASCCDQGASRPLRRAPSRHLKPWLRAQKGKPDYSWQTADRLSALSYSKHNPEAAQHQNGGHAGTNGMNGFGHTPNASSGPSWGMADMPPMPSSAKGGRPGFRGSARRRPEGPGSVELLPSSSVPSHADVV